MFLSTFRESAVTPLSHALFSPPFFFFIFTTLHVVCRYISHYYLYTYQPVSRNIPMTITDICYVILEEKVRHSVSESRYFLTLYVPIMKRNWKAGSGVPVSISCPINRTQSPILRLYLIKHLQWPPESLSHPLESHPTQLYIPFSVGVSCISNCTSCLIYCCPVTTTNFSFYISEGSGTYS